MRREPATKRLFKVLLCSVWVLYQADMVGKSYAKKPVSEHQTLSECMAEMENETYRLLKLKEYYCDEHKKSFGMKC